MIHGILNVYKEKGFTSHDVVAKLRGIVGQRKIGHTGTLDPDAVGVLPVCLGKATKVVSLLTEKNKTYEAVLHLGMETDTQDSSGKLLREASTADLTDEDVEKCILSFIGDYEQLPPMYSAIKIDGKKLYELAREGKEVERKKRLVSIVSIDIQSISIPLVRLEVTCSKGTYIRTLCHDIGKKLGCGGHMEALVRTQVENFSIRDAKTLTEIEELVARESLQSILIPIDSLFGMYPKLILEGDTLCAVSNGNPIRIKVSEFEKICAKWIDVKNPFVRIYNEEGLFLALYSYDEQRKAFYVEKMFMDKNMV